MHDALLHRQWSDLRAWIGEEVVPHLHRPSALDGWTIRDLVAHLGRSFTTLEAASPSIEPPLSILDYVSGYRPVARQIAQATRAQAIELADGLLPGIDRLADRALEALAALRSDVIKAPRGPIRRDDFVVTRLLELVVHGDDLARSLPGAAVAPLRPEAVDLVAQALADGYEERTGGAPDGPMALSWIREATGRSSTTDPNLPLL